jgi:GNAT superfamily N-acetyltransferase
VPAGPLLPYAHHRDLPPHWYLLYIGTTPPRQGRGLGGALLRSVLDRCDVEGVPAHLEATCERNVPLYRRRGFAERGAPVTAGGSPPLAPMWRDPR